VVKIERFIKFLFQQFIMAEYNLVDNQQLVGIFSYRFKHVGSTLASLSVNRLGHNTEIIGDPDADSGPQSKKNLADLVKRMDSAVILQEKPTDGLDILDMVRNQDPNNHVCFVYEGQRPPIEETDTTHVIISPEVTPSPEFREYLSKIPGIRK
jgi:hypothetical protein